MIYQPADPLKTPTNHKKLHPTTHKYMGTHYQSQVQSTFTVRMQLGLGSREEILVGRQGLGFLRSGSDFIGKVYMIVCKRSISWVKSFPSESKDLPMGKYP